VDLGALRSFIPERLFTEDKLIELAPAALLNDLERLRKVFAAKEKKTKKQFQLIGRRDLRTNNSWMHNSYRLVKGGNRCTLLINPADAKELNISNNQEVEVQSRTGKLRIQTEISEEMMSGVVSIPHGWGHDKEGINLDIASAHAGVSINDVTDDKFIDELTGNAAFSGVWVTVTA
jgi:anaerobic selenocysteine-containing dehydrogenase